MIKQYQEYQNFGEQYTTALSLLESNPRSGAILFLRNSPLANFFMIRKGLKDGYDISPIAATHPITYYESQIIGMDPVDIFLRYLRGGFTAEGNSENAVFGDRGFECPITCCRSKKRGFEGDKLYLKIRRGFTPERGPKLLGEKNKIFIESATPEDVEGILELGWTRVEDNHAERQTRMMYLEKYFPIAREKIKIFR
ncbi:MAG: hypothetical protein JW716_03845 [Candidatus Aenigmarchaeota archaeon]|nr:hypothetical protein [Candidatus Aenigmarchaeota archaeon]